MNYNRCPTCGRRDVVYHRTITAAMAAALLLIFRRGDGKWVHLPTFKMVFQKVGLRAALAGGDVNKLRFWGLLEEMQGTRQDGSRRIGMVRITPEGEQFCREERKVFRYADVRSNTLQGLWGPFIGIREALKQKFSYEELLSI